MNVRLAESVLNKVDFNSWDDWDTYPESAYKCNCGQTVAFNFRHFQKHSFSNFTNLEAAAVTQIEALVNDTIKSETNSFLDFHCPNCKNPVRFYFFSWAGGRHGEYGYRIKFVIE
ncbi:MAG: hypothetical protein IAE95_04535 [Chitinophagaceae bacterium]|nr:hypothetical protein [Chitinophagaceae bacterium]